MTIFIFAIISLAVFKIDSEAFALTTITDFKFEAFDVETGEYKAHTQTSLYAKDIRIAMNTTASKIGITEYLLSDDLVYVEKSVSLIDIQQSSFVYYVKESGTIRLQVQSLDGQGKVVESFTYFIKNDSTAPLEPQLDMDVFNDYHTSPFAVPYILLGDKESGLDYNKSRYRFLNFNNKQILFGGFDSNAMGDVRYIGNIDQNGTLIFELYDIVGNMTTYSYAYTLYGVGDSLPPVITISPETAYAKSVTVTIDWGEGYNYLRYYEIDGTSFSYTEPIQITTEGDITIVAYYYHDGKKLYVEKTVSNVDKTAPDRTIMQENIRVYCDLTSQMPIYMTVTVKDMRSGIKSVTVGNKTLESPSKDVYIMDITGLSNVTIVAKDYADNTTSVQYSFLKYDYDGITEYCQRFSQINADDYDINGYQLLLNAFNNLATYFVMESATTADISIRKRAVDDAIVGLISITCFVNNVPTGLSGIFDIDISEDATSIKRGGRANVVLDNSSLDNQKNEQFKNKALTISGMSGAEVFSLNLSLKNITGAIESLTKAAQIKIMLPSNTVFAKIYVKDGDNLRLLSSTMQDGQIIAQTDKLGDFYIVCIRNHTNNKKGFVVGGRLISYAEVGITAGIIGGVVLIGLGVVLIASRKKKKEE